MATSPIRNIKDSREKKKDVDSQHQFVLAQADGRLWNYPILRKKTRNPKKEKNNRTLTHHFVVPLLT